MKDTNVDNMNDQDYKFKIISDKGESRECTLLFTYKVGSYSYIVYTDHTVVDGRTRVFASIYDPLDKDGNLKPIESESDWDMLETLLELQLQDIEEIEE